MRGNFIPRFILFLFAYIPIYLILALKSYNPGFLKTGSHYNSFYHLFKHNYISIILVLLSLLLIVYFYFYKRINFKSQGNPKFAIKSITSQNKEYITYLGTYILPFVAAKTATPYDIAAYVVLFLTIGLIYIRTNLIYTNPMLLFFGYDLFEVVDDMDNKIVCISNVHFHVGDKPAAIKLGEKTFIISKWTKQN